MLNRCHSLRQLCSAADAAWLTRLPGSISSCQCVCPPPGWLASNCCSSLHGWQASGPASLLKQAVVGSRLRCSARLQISRFGHQNQAPRGLMFSAWAPSPAPLAGMAGQQLQQQQPLVVPIPAIQSQSARLGSCCSNQPALLAPEWPGSWALDHDIHLILQGCLAAYSSQAAQSRASS